MSQFKNYFMKNIRLEKVKILCIGDIILDKFISGNVERVSPEAPIPILNTREEKYVLGGVGNVIANISSLGASSEIISCIGSDLEGKIIRNLISQLVNTKVTLKTDRSRISTSKERYVSGSQHLLRVDKEEKNEISANLEKKIKLLIRNRIDKFDVVILSDYGKGFLTKSLTKEIIKISKKNKIPIIVDPNGKDYRKYLGCTVITPNKLELSLASGLNCKSDNEVSKAAKKIKSENKVNYVLVTRSEEGMTLFRPSGKPLTFKSEAREVYDVSGAGDTVVATLGVILGAGGGMEVAAKISNFAAGLVIAKFGTSVIKKNELSDYINNKINKKYVNKVINLKSGLDIISDWRQEKFSIGFTNGVFDIMHDGHLESLNFCKDYCDKLIIGLNSDNSAKKLKGDGRPINSQEFRSKMLSLLEIVDLVVIFNDTNPLNLIKEIRPNYLFKGSDYNLSSIVGRKFVEGYGGKVMLTPYLKGRSSSNIISKIKTGK